MTKKKRYICLFGATAPPQLARPSPSHLTHRLAVRRRLRGRCHLARPATTGPISGTRVRSRRPRVIGDATLTPTVCLLFIYLLLSKVSINK